jgi:hypothetical protein
MQIGVPEAPGGVITGQWCAREPFPSLITGNRCISKEPDAAALESVAVRRGFQQTSPPGHGHRPGEAAE